MSNPTNKSLKSNKPSKQVEIPEGHVNWSHCFFPISSPRAAAAEVINRTVKQLLTFTPEENPEAVNTLSAWFPEFTHEEEFKLIYKLLYSDYNMSFNATFSLIREEQRMLMLFILQSEGVILK